MTVSARGKLWVNQLYMGTVGYGLYHSSLCSMLKHVSAMKKRKE